MVLAVSVQRPAAASSLARSRSLCLPAAPFRAMSSSQARRRSLGAAATPTSHPVVALAAAAASGAGEDVKGEMLAPSLSNKNWVRFLAVSATVAAASRGTAYLPAAGIAFVHLLAWGTWLGTLVYTTFVVGLTLFKNLPRQTFGRVQSKLFPQYFALSSICSAIQMGVLVFAAAHAPQKQLILMGVGLGTSLLSLLAVEPYCTRIMFERYDLENAAVRDEGKIEALRKQFGMWHGISSLINLGTMVTAVGHGWWLASNLVGILA